MSSRPARLARRLRAQLAVALTLAPSAWVAVGCGVRTPEGGDQNAVAATVAADGVDERDAVVGTYSVMPSRDGYEDGVFVHLHIERAGRSKMTYSAQRVDVAACLGDVINEPGKRCPQDRSRDDIAAVRSEHGTVERLGRQQLRFLPEAPANRFPYLLLVEATPDGDVVLRVSPDSPMEPFEVRRAHGAPCTSDASCGLRQQCARDGCGGPCADPKVARFCQDLGPLGGEGGTPGTEPGIDWPGGGR